jgi:archaellum biogenesis ATPase FlaH
MAFRGGNLAAASSSIGEIGASDAAISTPESDRLDFAPLARGISRFLRNESTEPPLTLAIAGDWGTGKSSLMQLLCAELRRNGCKPVWFNAWHHQKEEHLLAALLNAVTKTGLPSWLSPIGWLFRFQLLWIRSRKHFAISFALIALIAAVTAYLLSHAQDDWAKLWSWISVQSNLLDALGGILQGKAPASAKLSPIVAQLVTIIATVTALVRGMKAFGADPAVLLSSVAERFRLRDAVAQNSYRITFAEQFAEVTEALPYRSVIVIDDLDRCKPEAVLEVMEAVNFLTSSGKCFIVFGMATSRVQAALGLAFEKIAHEMVELDTAVKAPEQKDDVERERRRSYARDYLEKIVNIEIQVPRRDDIAAHRLLLVEVSATRREFGRWCNHLIRLWPVGVAALAVVVGAALGVWFAPPEPVKSEATTAVSVAPVVPRPFEKLTVTVDTKAHRTEPVVIIPGDSSSISMSYLWIGLVLLLLAMSARV